MDEIHLKYSNVRPERMTNAETGILDTCYSDLLCQINPICLTEYLHKMKFIDQDFYEEFNEKAILLSNKQLFEFLISRLTNICSLLTLINIMIDLGYHRVAGKLMELWVLPKASVARVNRVDTSNRKQVQQYFKMLKRKVWNAEFKDPLKNLRSLAMRLQSNMSAECNTQKRQVLADKVVAVLGAEIDAHAITFDTELSEHPLFKELREIVPQTTNTMVTDVILYGRRANACAIGKNFSLSEKCLQKAKSYSAFMTPCLELANMVYCEVYVRLWQFEQNPSDQIRESLIQMAEVGIECLREEEEEIRLLWTRMFLLRMAFCLLGIGNRANIIPNYEITPQCLIRARHIAEILELTLNDMDTRREMFYRMTLARIYHLEGNIQLAFHYVKLAFQLAMEGKFKEKSFICTYKKEIESQLNSLKKCQLGPFTPTHSNICDALNPDSIGKSTSSCTSGEWGSLVLHLNRSTQSPVTFDTHDKDCRNIWSPISLVQVPHLNMSSFELTSDSIALPTHSAMEMESTFENINLESTADLNIESFEIVDIEQTTE